VTKSPFIMPISEEIWGMKYQLKTEDGTPIDNTVNDTQWRIANALAEAEKPELRSYWAQEFRNILEGFAFLNAGRITAGAGTNRNVTLSNCFTMDTIGDDLGDIYRNLREAALTMKEGGGIGYDFSTLRPSGALVKGVSADSSGPLSFMDNWDSMCYTIMSAGGRRGAMMATMRCDHPDIFNFIAAKADPARLRRFNMSILVTDKFMDAVKADGSIDLVFGDKVYDTVSARHLWDTMMQATYDYAEPGVIFIDRVNRDHNIGYLETIATTNPCGEKPMGPYASCLLSSANLSQFVVDPFGSNAHLDVVRLVDTVSIGVRMMDNVVDVGRFPLEAQLEKAKADRQLGLGITGMADMLAMLGIRYGSDEAAEYSEQVMKQIHLTAYKTSISLAREKGAFPNFDADGFLREGTAASRLPAKMQDDIANSGIRNALLTSIAPTGTISLYANNVSSGIEPTFAHEYTRNVTQKDGSRIGQRVVSYAKAKWEEINGEGTPMPDYCVTTADLTPTEHIKMQAAVQKWVDSSISKTVIVPEDIPFDAFTSVYMEAYDTGCKGCTTYRPNAITGSILTIDEPEKAEEVAEGPVESSTEPMERPEVLLGSTYKLKWPGAEHALYVTINDAEVGNERIPFEIFINSKNMEHHQWVSALTRMISAVFRRGGDVTFVAEELKSVFDPNGGMFFKQKFVPSIIAAIGGVIQEHFTRINYMVDETLLPFDSDEIEPVEIEKVESTSGEYCPKCHSTNYVKQGGCDTCFDCGHSKCS
jgi:ribonucleoside-diphosphate reductase alpha chain